MADTTPINLSALDAAAAAVRAHWPDATPQAALICGSGWSPVAEAFDDPQHLPYEAIPGLGRPGVVGHAGRLTLARSAGVETLIFQGRRHFYEGVGWTAIALPLYVAKILGVRDVLLTNSAGAIRSDLKPGDLVAITDHINMIGSNPLIGDHMPIWGPRFPDQSTVYNPALRDALHRAAIASGVPLHDGIYVASSGPVYESPAEVRAFQAMGADMVGMSTVPEAQLANAAGMRVAGLSCMTNFAAGISPHPLSHEEVTAATAEAMPRMHHLVLAYWAELGKTHVS